jgi:O-methyltransferase involved in polyketide biosynthesis
MQSEKVHLTQKQETLLATLYCKALDSRSKTPILNDKAAEGIVRHIDYDFPRLKIAKDDVITDVIRAKQFDAWTTDFLADHPDATVLHLACGLDGRVNRVAHSKNVRWYDLDYPEVIELRKRFYPPRDGYFMIGSSVTDPSFLNEVQTSESVMIVAEGLVMYLSEQEVKELLQRLTSHFQSGQLAFDVLSRLTARLAKFQPAFATIGPSSLWGIDDLKTIEQWVPRLQLVREMAWTEVLKNARISWAFRVIYRMTNHIPSLRRVIRFVLYRF